MSNISDQISALLREVKNTKPTRGKKKPASTKGKDTQKAKPLSTPIPWVDEALVLIATTTTCKYCSNEVTSWSPYIYIERSRTIRGKVSTTIERLPHCDPDNAYTHLARRVEHRHHTTCHCHICFGNLPNGFPHGQVQLQFPFETPQPPQRQEEYDNG